MWSIKYISAENFMSFDNVEFEFKNKCYVVRANNKDNEGQLSNGGGKTSFVDIASIALLGTSLTGRSLKDCVKWDNDSKCFTIKLLMENEAHSMTCYIERTVFNNTKGQELIILVNDEVPKSIPSKKGVEGGVDVRLGDKYILEELLDITKEDLFNHYFISTLYYQPFLKISTDNKLSVISRFSSATVVDKVIDGIKIDSKATSALLLETKNDISEVTGYISALKDSLNSDAKKEEFNKNKKARLLGLMSNINRSEERVVEISNRFSEIEQEIESLVTQEEFPDQVLELRELIALSEQEILDRKLDRKEIVKDISSIEKYEADLITCPKCEHEFTLDNVDKWKKGDLAKKKKQLDLVNKGIEELESGIQDIKGELERLTDIETENKTILRKTQSLIKEQEDIAKRLDSIDKEIESFNADMASIEKETFEDQSSHIKKSIKEKEKELDSLKEQLQLRESEGADLLQWIDNFENFKFYLGNKPIEVICSLVNDHLKSNGSDLSLNIEGFKKLKSGEIRQALNPIIYRNWNNPQPYSQFSEGEKVRLNLAVDLAFQKLINDNSKYGGLDWYCSDELINSLDSLGVASVARSFDRLGKNIVLVTHSGESVVYDNIIQIEKENGISKVAKG